jgi:hypothetical protein
MRMVRIALLLVSLLFSAGMMTAGEKPPDPHYLAQRTSVLARRSVFVHGYLHGYEEGFHLADLDIQMGRSARDISKTKEAREVSGYRHEFGDKRFFEGGYREGLRVGYADGMAGRVFRAINELQALGEMAPQGPKVQPDPAFDRGFSEGYLSGQQQGVQDGRRDVTATPPAAACPATRGQEQPSFCAAYVGGYRIGYSDGFTNVARPMVAQAEARGGSK